MPEQSEIDSEEIVRLIKTLGVTDDPNVSWALDLYRKGTYEIHVGQNPPRQYNEYFSEMCMGWVITSDQVGYIVVSLGNGIGNRDEPYDAENQALHIWLQNPASEVNTVIDRSVKRLMHDRNFVNFKKDMTYIQSLIDLTPASTKKD